mmetsp:Transcript_39319/g.47637  ORF Transcript_39319/g.47637 Transcript_39319/m.47637 type:complete len:234 (-) Transcript_39319:210-911(-)
MSVLAFFDLVDLLFPSQLQVVSQHFHLLLILLLELLRVQFELLAQLSNLLGVLKLELSDDIFVSQLHLLEIQLQRTLVLLEVLLSLKELVLLQLESHLSVCLQGGDIVLVFVQQMLDLLLVHLDFDLVPLLHFFHLSVLVTKLCLLVFQVLLGDFPESIDFVTLQLHVVTVLFFLVLLFLERRNLRVELLRGGSLDIPTAGCIGGGLILPLLPLIFSLSLRHFYLQHKVSRMW